MCLLNADVSTVVGRLALRKPTTLEPFIASGNIRPTSVILFLQPLSPKLVNFVVSFISSRTDHLFSHAAAWTESTRPWVLLAAGATFLSSVLISFTTH